MAFRQHIKQRRGLPGDCNNLDSQSNDFILRESPRITTLIHCSYHSNKHVWQKTTLFLHFFGNLPLPNFEITLWSIKRLGSDLIEEGVCWLYNLAEEILVLLLKTEHRHLQFLVGSWGHRDHMGGIPLLHEVAVSVALAARVSVVKEAGNHHKDRQRGDRSRSECKERQDAKVH